MKELDDLGVVLVDVTLTVFQWRRVMAAVSYFSDVHEAPPDYQRALDRAHGTIAIKLVNTIEEVRKNRKKPKRPA